MKKTQKKSWAWMSLYIWYRIMLIYINFKFNFLTKYRSFILNCWRIRDVSQAICINHERPCCIRREKWQNEWPGRYLLVVVNEFVSYFNNWPQYIKVDQYVPGGTLRSSSHIQLEVPTESGTFQDSAAAAFNSLPDCLRNCKDFNIFRTSMKD